MYGWPVFIIISVAVSLIIIISSVSHIKILIFMSFIPHRDMENFTCHTVKFNYNYALFIIETLSKYNFFLIIYVNGTHY